MLTILALVAAVQAAPVPAPTEAQVFRDWAVACDNGRQCQAAALMPEGGDWERFASLFVERGSEPGAPLLYRLSGGNEAPVRLAIDGTVMPVRIVTDDPDMVVEPRDREAFQRALLAGRELQLQGATGGVVGTASLSGLTAALLYMDEQQGRAGTRHAGRPAPRLPQVRLAPPTAERPIAIPAARIAQLRRQLRCTLDEVGGPDDVETAALGGGATLVLLACGAGAYNVSMVPLIARRQGRTIRIDPAPFDVPLADYEREEGRRLLVNAAWVAETRSIEDFAKARGLGDCGTRSRYAWDGTRFRLVHQEEMPECRGSITFLTTWRAEVR